MKGCLPVLQASAIATLGDLGGSRDVHGILGDEDPSIGGTGDHRGMADLRGLGHEFDAPAGDGNGNLVGVGGSESFPRDQGEKEGEGQQQGPALERCRRNAGEARARPQAVRQTCGFECTGQDGCDGEPSASPFSGLDQAQPSFQPLRYSCWIQRSASATPLARRPVASQSILRRVRKAMFPSRPSSVMMDP